MASKPQRLPKKVTPPRQRSPKPPLMGRSQAPERSALEMQTLQLFRTIVGSARSHDAEIRKLTGVPGAQLWALSEISRNEGLSVNTLSERMALHQTTASNLVNGLAERNLIKRSRDDTDQRIARLHVTTEGRRMLASAPGPYAGLLPDAIHHLRSDELVRLAQCLTVLVGTLKRPIEGSEGEPLLGL